MAVRGATDASERRESASGVQRAAIRWIALLAFISSTLTPGDAAP